MERDPSKRQVKPPHPSALLDFDISGESSDDSDFRIEDHCEESDDDSLDSHGGNQNGDESGSDGSEESEDESKMTIEELLQQAEIQKAKSGGGVDSAKIMICCCCLGDRSDAHNEIVECDSCGVTVHEACYGVSESDSVSSTVSSCSTEPWFCEACRAGVDNPTCELCPNFGGIFKETDTGKWVHLVCALYIPGVAFAEVDKLVGVTLFEMAYNKWGARACSLCTDQRFTRTGVCIGCDAGLCRTYFHVTCGQREGLLSEAHSEELDQADPYYAHCKLHSDKVLLKKRRRNWLALELRTAQRRKQYAVEGYCNQPAQVRTQRKLNKYRQKHASFKVNKPAPWVPTQKMARLLTSSASVCRSLWRKAALSGVDTEAWALREAQTAALADVHRKWHIAPAFSVEFIGYYLDRNNRMQSMKQQLSVLLDENSKLVEAQQKYQAKYDEALKEHSEAIAVMIMLKATAKKYHELILKVAPNKKLPNLELIGKPVARSHPLDFVDVFEFRDRPDTSVASLGTVPTPAALKAGVGFPLGFKQMGVPHRVSGSTLGLNEQCGICRRTTDQHLLAKCDTCHLHYHLGCLTPPLTRMPKKTKQMGWQCSECDKDSSDSEMDCPDPEAPRQLRKLKENGNGDTPPPKSADEKEDPPAHDTTLEALESALSSPGSSSAAGSGRSGKKRRREKHHRYSPEPAGSSQVVRPHKRKRKRKSVDTPESGADGEQNRPALKIFDNFTDLPPLISSTNCILYPRQIQLQNPTFPSSPQCTFLPAPNHINFKSIPHPTGEGSSYAVTPGGVYQASNIRPVMSPPPPANFQALSPRTPPAKKFKEADAVIMCDTCNLSGTNSNIVRCDECLKGFHFHCLDPPVKKSPKVRGYSWHCADCDPTESDSS